MLIYSIKFRKKLFNPYDICCITLAKPNHRQQEKHHKQFQQKKNNKKKPEIVDFF